MKRIIGTFVVGCLGGISSFFAAGYLGSDQPRAYIVEHPVKEVSPVSFTGNGSFAPEANTIDFTYAAESTVNSVVHIQTETSIAYPRDPVYEYFFGPAPRKEGIQQGSGSGVIVASDGYIVTNNHVINGAEKISVTLNNNRTYPATVVGADPGTDIALLKIEASQLPAIQFGNSDEVKLGEWVLAVGNPFNLTSTVTAGIVSAKSRNIHILEGNPDANIFPIESFIQTDAAVNPGNSGGALVNSRGELIGINTAIASQTGSYSGYSFAVPVNLVQKVTNDLRKFGVVQRAFLGVNIRNLDQDLAATIGVDDLNGVYVGGLVPNGAAEKSGIKEGDIILYVGSAPVNSATQLQEQVGRYRPGDEVDVRVIRNKQEMIIPVVLRNAEGTTSAVKKEDIEVKYLHGASFGKISLEEKAALRLEGGAKVTSLNRGKLAQAGLKKGFIITRIDKEEIRSPEQVYSLLEKKKGGVTIEGVFPNGMKGYYSIGL